MNWKTHIADLRSCGLSQSEIGRRLGKSQAWVSAVERGEYDDLKWGDGEALRALHSKVCGALHATTLPPEQESC